MGRTSIRSALAAIAVLAILAVAVFGIAACADQEEPTPVEHPAIASGQSCTSCKEAPQHDYSHKPPYTGTCDTCHVTSSWRNVNFDHENDVFDASFHGLIGCAWCHTEAEPVLQDTKCQECHAARSPHEDNAGDCATCHTTTAWALNAPVPENHLSLLGGHSGLSCFMCHSGVVIAQRARGCVDCHGTNHGGLTKCEDCHDPMRDWEPTEGFDHNAFFVLEGAHADADCTRCHAGGKFVGTPTTCVGCHGTKHGGLTNCQDCHTPKNGNWTPKAGFNHAAFFPLAGRHALVQCTSCHKNAKYAGTPTVCIGCHGDQHRGLTDCQRCHSPLKSWAPVGFSHDVYFKLDGKHTAVTCTKCHVNSVFDGTPTVCATCHGVRHGGLSGCAACHTTAGFVPSTFKHSTKFSLVGAHASLACSKCHPSNEYANVIGTGTDCEDCHAPRHGDVYTSCSVCHNTTSWAPVKDTVTHPAPVVLGTEHRSRSCTLCHETLIFEDPVKPCEDCHLVDVPHAGPTDCIRCHIPTAWAEVQFLHAPIEDHVFEGPDPQYSDCTLCHQVRDYTTYNCDLCHAPGSVTPTGPVIAGLPLRPAAYFRAMHVSVRR